MFFSFVARAATSENSGNLICINGRYGLRMGYHSTNLLGCMQITEFPKVATRILT